MNVKRRNALEKELKTSLKRQTKSKTLYTLFGDGKTKIRVIDAPYNAEVRSYLLEQHGDNIQLIVNEDINGSAKFLLERAV